jgi:hypothetical protein
MYTVDADKVTIRDLIALQKSGGDIDAVMPILRKCVTVDDGREVDDLPAKHLRLITQALMKRVQGDDVGN